MVGMMGCAKQGGSHLSEQKMEAVLRDIQLAESYSMVLKNNAVAFSGGKDIDSLACYYKGILAHHQITDQQLEESLRWYVGHPDELDSVYTRMLPEITRVAAKYAE